MNQIPKFVLNNGGSEGSEGQNGSNSQIRAEQRSRDRKKHKELEHKLDIEKKRQRERVKVINQQQIAMKEASCPHVRPNIQATLLWLEL